MKFRAMIKPIADDPRNKTIIEFTLQDLVQINPPFSIRELLIPWLREGNKPIRYTGLQDKNGKEIYEGDIVRWLNNPIWEIKWHGHSFWLWNRYARTMSDELGNGRSFRDITHEIEIIGNIYEHPELLEKETT